MIYCIFLLVKQSIGKNVSILSSASHLLNTPGTSGTTSGATATSSIINTIRRPVAQHDDGRQRLRICFSPPEITPVPSKDTSALKHLTRHHQTGHLNRRRHLSGFRHNSSDAGASNAMVMLTGATASGSGARLVERDQRGGTKSLSTTPVRVVLFDEQQQQPVVSSAR